MKSFDELYEMYKNGDEHLYDDLTDADAICEIIDECNKDLAKYYEFEQFLYSMLEY